MSTSGLSNSSDDSRKCLPSASAPLASASKCSHAYFRVVVSFVVRCGAALQREGQLVRCAQSPELAVWLKAVCFQHRAQTSQHLLQGGCSGLVRSNVQQSNRCDDGALDARREAALFRERRCERKCGDKGHLVALLGAVCNRGNNLIPSGRDLDAT